MKILVVEDDFLQGDATCQALKKDFPRATVELLSTEYDFRAQLDRLAIDPPRVVIMDIKLPWQELTPNKVQPPKEVRREGDRRAGIRCREVLVERSEFGETHVLFFSHILSDDLRLEIDQMEGNVSYLDKGATVDLDATAFRTLADTVRSCLNALE